MPFDFINSTLQSTATNPLKTVGQAIVSRSGLVLPEQTYNGITGTLTARPSESVAVGSVGFLISGSFTSSLGWHSHVYVVNGLFVSSSA